jgi:hypothetical protein
MLFASKGFDVSASVDGPLLVAEGLRRLLADAGIQVLARDETGIPRGVAWTEAGDIDKYGHEYGWRLCHQLPNEVRTLVDRCQQLIEAGWQQVQIVTDHGWLLLPGGMPKVELPEHLTEVRKGRCARLKDASAAVGLTAPWHWDSAVRIALAPGIACFEANKEYEHGGLSLQECVTPVLSVSMQGSATVATAVIQSVAWTQLRCRFVVKGAPDGSRVDLRSQPANAASSVAGGERPLDAEGRVSLLVDDEDLTGEAIYAVVLGADGAVLQQMETTVGGAA